MEFLRPQRDISTVDPTVVFSIGEFPVTDSLMLSFIITILVVTVSIIAYRRFSMRPGSLQNIVEMLYEQMLALTEQITGNRSHARRIFPIIGALFVYVGLANLIGLIPGFSSFTFAGESLFRTPTSDFNTTFALAAAMVILVQIASIQSWGVFGYIGRYIKIKELVVGFRKGFKDGLLAFIDFLVGFLDIISEFAKVISLSFRLFGNMFAGEILAVLLLGAFAYLLPSLWLSLNLLFAVVQAVVFGALVAGYYTLAVRTDVDYPPRVDEPQD